MQTPNIRMIWLDYGRVLFDHFSDQLVETLSQMSFPQKPPVIIIRKIYRSGAIRRYDLGAISTEEFLKEMRALIGFLDCEEFLRVWSRVLQRNLRMWELVDDLLRHGYPCGVISNTNELHAMHIENLLALKQSMSSLQPRIYSYREKVEKPNPEIWRRAIEQANVTYGWERSLLPQECVFVDDIYENVRSFQEFGGHAICHNPQFVHRTAAHLLDLGVQL